MPIYTINLYSYLLIHDPAIKLSCKSTIVKENKSFTEMKEYELQAFNKNSNIHRCLIFNYRNKVVNTFNYEKQVLKKIGL